MSNLELATILKQRTDNMLFKSLYKTTKGSDIIQHFIILIFFIRFQYTA